MVADPAATGGRRNDDRQVSVILRTDNCLPWLMPMAVQSRLSTAKCVAAARGLAPRTAAAFAAANLNQPTMKGCYARLGRKNYTQEELDHCKATVDQQLAADKNLVKAVADATKDEKVNAALEAFETLFFNNLTSSWTATSSIDCEWSPARTATRSTKSRCYATA